MGEEIEVYIDGEWVKGTMVSTPDTDSRSLVFRVADLSGGKWAVRVPRQQPDEEKSSYSARCWQQARLEQRLAEQTLSSLPIAEARLLPARLPSHLFIDFIDASDIEHISVNESSLSTPYPLWATARPWAEGVPLLPSNIEMLPIHRLGPIMLDLATLFHELTELDILYLPMGEHILISEGRVSRLLGYGHAGYLWDGTSTTRFIAGLYGQTVDKSGARENLRLKEIMDSAMCSLGEYLWELSNAYQCRTDSEKESRDKMMGVGTKAWANQYVDWPDMIEDLTVTVDPSDSLAGGTTVRIGVFCDYGNIKTRLFGWDIELGAIVGSFGRYSERRRVRARVATVVGTEERDSKRQVAETLRGLGFTVLELPAQDGKANQVDDKALMSEMLARADQLDEVVLLTADGDYVDTVKTLKRKGLRIKIVHFSPLSKKYDGVVDDTVDGLIAFAQHIYPKGSSSRTVI